MRFISCGAGTEVFEFTPHAAGSKVSHAGALGALLAPLFCVGAMLVSLDR